MRVYYRENERLDLETPQEENFLKRYWFIVIATVIVFVADLFVNYSFARNIAPLYPLKIIPPGYFFSIWLLIYAFMIFMMNLWIIKPNPNMRDWIDLNVINFLNMTWLFLSVSGWRTKLYFTVINLFLLSAFCYNLWRSLVRTEFKNKAMELFCANFMSFYLGWTVCASVLNFCQLLHYKFLVREAIVFIVFFALTGLVILAYTKAALFSHRPAVRSIGFYLSAGWGIMGVLIASKRNFMY